MLLVEAVALATVHSVMWWWLHGVVITSLQGQSADGETVWQRGLALVPVMGRLFALALTILLLYSAAIGGGAYALLRATRSSPQALIWYQIGAVAAVVWLLGYIFLVAVHDQARLRAARHREGALPAYRWAFNFVLHGGERAFLLACALQISSVFMYLAYQAVSLNVPINYLLGLSGSLLWGEAFLWLRMWIRVWFFAAQNEIQP